MRLHSHAYKIWLLSLVQKQGTLAAAAIEARVSSSAVSQALAQLENVLETQLLVRSGKEVKLTSAGETLVVLFEPTNLLLENFEPSALHASELPRRIRIGAYESLAVDLFPRFVPAFRSLWPGIDIQIETGRSRYLLDKCRNHELDLVFVVEATHGPNIYVRPFAEDRFGIFARTDRLKGKSPQEVVEKLGLAVMRIDDKHHSKTFKRFLSRLPRGCRPTLVTESFEVILSLVRTGAMAGALPCRVAKRASEDIVLLDVQQHLPKPRGKSAEALSGAHDLFLVCHQTFSMRMFETIFKLSQSHSSTRT